VKGVSGISCFLLILFLFFGSSECTNASRTIWLWLQRLIFSLHLQRCPHCGFYSEEVLLLMIASFSGRVLVCLTGEYALHGGETLLLGDGTVLYCGGICPSITDTFPSLLASVTLLSMISLCWASNKGGSCNDSL